MTDPNSIETALGYLGWHKTQDERSFTGGLLIVNEEGFPQEFRCTEPIRPSTVQSILYGESFRRYMLDQLIGQNLFDHLTIRPEMVLVDDEDLWQLQGRLPVHVVYLSMAGGDDELAELADTDYDVDRSFVDTPRGGRVVVAVRGGALEDAVNCHRTLAACASRMDIYEPFSRVSAVLEALEKQAPREQ